MVLNELNILFENIQTFRGMLNEGVSANIFLEAIENNKYLYIYYASPDTAMKGYRIIKPFVLGTLSDGSLAVRAWQESGSSDSFGDPNRRIDHEYQNHTNRETNKTSSKPAWRLFKLEYITSALPTGKHFSVAPEDIPNKYNADDKQMTGGIMASVNVGNGNDIEDTETDNGSEITKIEPIKPVQGAEEPLDMIRKEATPNDIKDFFNVVTKVKHKPARNFIVVSDKKGVSLRNANDTRVPKESIIGNLNDLYLKLNVPKVINNKTFRNDIHNKAVKYFDSLKSK